MKTLIKSTVCALTLWSASVTFSLAGQDIAVADLPKAVTEAVLKKSPGAKLIDADKETKNGKVYYDIDYHLGAEKRTAKVWEDGTIKEDKIDK